MRFRILHKTFIGYAFYLALAFCFGLYVYCQIGQIMARQKLVEIADDTKEQLLELRRNEKNYIIRRDPLYIDNIHSNIKTLRTKLVAVKPDIIDAFSRGDYLVLMDSIRLYTTLIEQLVRNYQETNALTKELRNTGKEIEQQVVASKRPDWIQDLLEIRMLEENSILLMEENAYLALQKRAATLRNNLNGSGEGCGDPCDHYLETVTRLFEHNRQENGLLLNIRESANRMENIINLVDRRERGNIAGYVHSSQRLLLGALLFLGIFGLILSWFLAKEVSAPLQELEATVRRITDGDFELRLDLRTGDAETLSLKNSFNTMLDTLDLSRESLAKSMQLLQEKSAQLIESEKLASIGVLASGVAHEINNPLANISLTAETIVESLPGPPPDPEELNALLQDIVSQTERASSVVNNLLGFTRTVKDTSIGEVDLHTVLQQSLRLVSHEVRFRNIELKQNIPATPLLIRGNQGKLEQVFINIMLNAVQAMGHNGTLILDAWQDKSLHLAMIEITDTGPGIPEENIKKIFDPFFTTKSAGSGTGLGLYVTYGIIQEHGGDIEVTSTVGQGTSFRISLPLLSTEEAETGN